MSENNNSENVDPLDLPTPNIVNGKVNDKTMIILPSANIQIIDTAKKVFSTIAPHHSLFIRGRRVVELVKKGLITLGLSILTPAAVRTRFEEFCKFYAYRRTEKEYVLKPSKMSIDDARSLLESKEAIEYLHPINGIINCPILINEEDSIRLIEPGYDESSGLLITGGAKPEDVELHTAVESLKKIYSEYDFQTPSDESRALAAFITPALKIGGFLKGNIPAEVGEADLSQSGKTYRLKLIAAIYNELPNIIAKQEGGVGSIDEKFSDRLEKGRPFIIFDNLRGKLNSQFLEAFLTAEGNFTVRIPHKGNLEVDPSRFFVYMSSNGLETTIDLANRCSIVRIKKKPVGYNFTPYKEGDLLEHVRANQPFYLGCVFSIIKEWHRAGMPITSETSHDFREWAQTLGWIVQNILNEAPLLEGHREAQLRVSNPGLTFLRQLCIKAEATLNIRNEPLSATDIFNICQDEAIEIPGLNEFNQNKPNVGGQKIGSLLKPVFREKNTFEIDNFIITKTEKNVSRDDGKGSRNVPAYIFSKKGAPTILMPGSP